MIGVRVGVKALSEGRSFSSWLWIVGVLVPTLITVPAFVLIVMWMGDVPNPVAIHWNGAGAPNGFAPPWAYLVMVVVAAWLLPVGIAGSGIAAARKGKYSSMLRFLVASAVWLSVLMAVVSAGSIYIQRGLASAEDSPSVVPILLVGLGVATVLALISYTVLPKPPEVVPDPESHVEPMALAPGENVVWSGIASSTRWILVPILMLAASLVVAAVFTASTKSATAWVLLATSLFLLILMSMLGAFRVSVGNRGLLIRSYMGWPRDSVKFADVADVGVVNVNPVVDWGGWGWRIKPRARGVITRAGEALVVTRVNGTELVVTVDDARTAAAVLLALVDRARSSADAEARSGTSS